MVRRKYLGKPIEKYIKSSISKIIRIDDAEHSGYISFIKIFEVYQPLIVESNGNRIYLYNNGYSELNYLPDNQNWKMLALYDDNNEIIEWYFDITLKNSVDENGAPYCVDLYLDVILMPNGDVIIVDEDELKDAYINGKITKKDMDLAYTTKDKIISNKIVDIEYVVKTCKKFMRLFKEFEING